MRKRAIIVVAIILLLTVPVSAHPGRTDANGGHWDRANGTYHYHTGEYAGHSQTSSHSTAPTNPPVNLPKPAKSTLKQVRKEESIVPLKYCLFAIPVFCIITLIVRAMAVDKTETRERSERRKAESAYEKEIAELKEKNASANKKLAQLQSDYDTIIRKVSTWQQENASIPISRYRIQDMYQELPPDTFLNSDMLPISGKCEGKTPFGSYTVYHNFGSEVYHSRYLCGYATTPMHLFRALETLRPCRNCVHNQNMKEIPQWYLDLTQKQDPSSTETIP